MKDDDLGDYITAMVPALLIAARERSQQARVAAAKERGRQPSPSTTES
jgi:hypothetical protein